MRKCFLFIGAILFCLLFSCEKDNSPIATPPVPVPPVPTVVIDSFLLHPPPVLERLPIPLTKGTWWKYKRIDSLISHQPGAAFSTRRFDSSIELITVIGKSQFVNKVTGTGNNISKSRYDTVESVMLEVKNLTQNRQDTIQAYYYDAHFYITSKKYLFIDTFKLSIKVPQIEGTQNNTEPALGSNTLVVDKNKSITIFNTIFDNCIYTSESYRGGTLFDTQSGQSTVYLKPGVGFVFWSWSDSRSDHYGFSSSQDHSRSLIDYHIEP